jgi:hypothetical protein
MATKFTYKMRSGGKWDAGSGTRPTQKNEKIKIIIIIIIAGMPANRGCLKQHERVVTGRDTRGNINIYTVNLWS